MSAYEACCTLGVSNTPNGSKHHIEQQLAALDRETASGADVDAIIGNDSWTRIPTCDECERCMPEVVCIGVEPDYERRPAYVCRECLVRATALFSRSVGS